MTVWEYIELKARELRLDGREKTAVNYRKAARCLRRFRDDENLSFADITEAFVQEFNDCLYETGIQRSTISFYNRVLRSIYNQAVSDGLIRNAHPFDAVYTSVDSRPIPVKVQNSDGSLVSLDAFTKDEIITKYRNLQRRYNTLVGKIAELVRV